MWGGTGFRQVFSGQLVISIHPPRVGRDIQRVPDLALSQISIHPPRVGRDLGGFRGDAPVFPFQSTLPVWGGTVHDLVGRQAVLFQSTLPVWGGTVRAHAVSKPHLHFNPPSPCGEGLLPDVFADVFIQFQSTLPVWGGTQLFLPGETGFLFQSTLPVWGGTDRPPVDDRPPLDFNPPSPCGEGQQKLTKILCKLLR